MTAFLRKIAYPTISRTLSEFILLFIANVECDGSGTQQTWAPGEKTWALGEKNFSAGSSFGKRSLGIFFLLDERYNNRTLHNWKFKKVWF